MTGYESGAPHLPRQDELAAQSAASAPTRRRIGEIFVELGFITPDELDAALVVQGETGSLIGEVLVEQGKLSRVDLASALGEHWEARRRDAHEAPSPHVGGVTSDAPAGSIEATVSHVETMVANVCEALARLEMDRVSDGTAIRARLAAIESAILRLEAQAAQSSQVERDLNDELDRLDSQVEELWNQNRPQPTTAGEGAQPTEQESNESHSSVSETRTKPSATGKKQKHPKSRKKHKR